MVNNTDKSMAKKNPTKSERQHMRRVAELGCIICGAPAAIHHCRTGVGMSQRGSHHRTLPLCAEHHQTGGFGVAIHAGQRTWEARYGTEEGLLKKVEEMLNEQAC